MARRLSGPYVSGRLFNKQQGSPIGGATITVSATVYTDDEMQNATTTVTTNGTGDFQFYALPGLYTLTTTARDAAPIEPVEIIGNEGLGVDRSNSSGASTTGGVGGLSAALITQSVYAPKGWGSVWYPARNAAASQIVPVVYFGDSTTAGDSWSPGTSHPITQALRSLSIAAGYADGGRGSAPRGITDTATDSGIDNLAVVQSRSGFGTSGDVYGVYQALVPRSTTAADTITFQGKGTRVRLFYSRFNNGGAWSYSINGGAKTWVFPTAPTGVWQPECIEVTGLTGGGAVNTVTVTNEGGRKLAPISAATSMQAPSTGAGPASGSYFYVLTVYNTDKTQESAANSPGSAATVNGSQTANGLVNNTTATVNGYTYTNGQGRTYALYRGTSSGGPFGYIKDVAAAAGAQTSFTDDGTITPNMSRNPPGATPTNAADGSTSNDVKVTPEFYNNAGIVWHNAGISGAAANVYFDVADGSFNQAAQGLLGLFPVSATNADQQGRGSTSSNYRQPALVVINFGINELGSSSADTDALTYADRLSLGCRMAANAGADVVLICPPMDFINGSTAPPRARQGAFRQACHAVARSHGAAIVDYGVAMGPSATWPSKGYYNGSTNPHPSATGYDVQAAALWSLLSA